MSLTKIILLLLGTFVILAVLIFTGFSFWQKEQAMPQAQTSTQFPTNTRSQPISFSTSIANDKAISTADWKTYRNEKYGFEVKYPTRWTLSERKDLIASETPLIYLEKSNGATISILPKGEFDRGLGHVLSQEHITINGYPAVRTNYGDIGDGTLLVIVSFRDWFPSNRIELHTLKEGYKDSYTADLEEFRQIISTFQLF